MGVCEFCCASMFGDGYDITKRLGARGVALNSNKDIYRLEAWLFKDELASPAKLHIDITEYGDGEEFVDLEIPIKYCPRCGRELN